MPAAARPTPYFLPLTGVRALAALLIYLVHSNPLAQQPSLPFLRNVIFDFQIGVDIFFTLSGFLIVYRYLDALRLTGAGLRAFFLKRFARIYPLFWLITTLAAVGAGLQDLHNRNELIGLYGWNVTLLKGFSKPLKFSLIGQTWSLTVEETFYLFAPVLVAAYRRYRLWSFPLLALGLTLLGVLLVRLLAGNRLGFFDDLPFVFLWTFFGRWFEFFAGALLAVGLRHYGLGARWRARGPYCTTAAGLLFAAIVSASALLEQLYPHYLLDFNHVLLKNAADFLLLPIASALLFYGLLTERSWLARFFSTDALQLLGKSSYAFYLIHLGVLRTWVAEPLAGLLPHGQYLAALLVTTLLAIGLYRFVEQPVNLFIRRLGGV